MTEIIEHVFVFTLFVFNRRHRRTWISQYKRHSTYKKSFKIFELVLSAVVTIGLVLSIVLGLAGNSKLSSAIDKCLDSGGSYDYQVCECDTSNGHSYIEKNRCNWQVIGL